MNKTRKKGAGRKPLPFKTERICFIIPTEKKEQIKKIIKEIKKDLINIYKYENK